MSFQINLLQKVLDRETYGYDRYSYGRTPDPIADITTVGYFPMSMFRGELQTYVLIDVMCAEGFYTLRATVESGKVGIANGRYEIEVTSPDQLTGELDSSVLYKLDGPMDMGDRSITVPSTGLRMTSLGNDLGGVVSSADNHPLFVGDTAGDVFIANMYLSASGTGSQVFDLTDVDGTHALEFDTVNFSGCTSLGELVGFRQYLEVNTGRFGGTPELTFSGSWNGARVTTSIVRGISDVTAIFKAGPSLTFSGRVITDINCDLPATGALMDFSPANITNSESLQIRDAFITREGVLDPSDTGHMPNIDETAIQSLWSNNTGLPNTVKYLKARITATATTTFSGVGVYTPLLGTFTQGTASHIDMPSNGEFRRLAGTGPLRFSGDLSVVGTRGNVIDLRFMVSTDDGATWPTQIEHLSREVNNFAGGTDVAFFPISFIADLDEGDLLRVEVGNSTSTNSVTLRLDSYFDISQV